MNPQRHEPQTARTPLRLRCTLRGLLVAATVAALLAQGAAAQTLPGVGFGCYPYGQTGIGCSFKFGPSERPFGIEVPLNPAAEAVDEVLDGPELEPVRELLLEPAHDYQGTTAELVCPLELPDDGNLCETANAFDNNFYCAIPTYRGLVGSVFQLVDEVEQDLAWVRQIKCELTQAFHETVPSSANDVADAISERLAEAWAVLYATGYLIVGLLDAAIRGVSCVILAVTPGPNC